MTVQRDWVGWVQWGWISQGKLPDFVKKEVEASKGQGKELVFVWEVKDLENLEAFSSGQIQTMAPMPNQKSMVAFGLGEGQDSRVWGTLFNYLGSLFQRLTDSQAEWANLLLFNCNSRPSKLHFVTDAVKSKKISTLEEGTSEFFTSASKVIGVAPQFDWVMLNLIH